MKNSILLFAFIGLIFSCSEITPDIYNKNRSNDISSNNISLNEAIQIALDFSNN